ncbi:DUF4124 domain-containing protein [Microbulbifer spongiae]|uniref:DUF4124 domain-containing protein n=1 Tax=Microbulbifer spongiae TaxID=2944933 RepID=A0ABY9EB56_9GAMM|nr:DUF4124 domain-containing protein [Microbulbifer sp. MI-G]WKD50220.1 DUF4124 domain-containing protein [Microbulbifer sp. MI-G]
MNTAQWGMACASLLLAMGAAAGELYRWVDEDGRVYFSDRPPVETQAQDISDKLEPINSIDGNRTQRSAEGRRPHDIEREYAQHRQQQQQQQQQARQRALKRICQQARQRLNALNGRVAFIDENGREVRYSERERQQMAKKLSHEIAQRCD